MKTIHIDEEAEGFCRLTNQYQELTPFLTNQYQELTPFSTDPFLY
jgi:hypothetical protein